MSLSKAGIFLLKTDFTGIIKYQTQNTTAYYNSKNVDLTGLCTDRPSNFLLPTVQIEINRLSFPFVDKGQMKQEICGTFEKQIANTKLKMEG